MMTTFIGIDWADKKHDVCALSPKGDVLAEFIIADTVKGYEQLHTFLKSQNQVEILIEKPNGLIVEFLLRRGWFVKVITPGFQHLIVLDVAKQIQAMHSYLLIFCV